VVKEAIVPKLLDDLRVSELEWGPFQVFHVKDGDSLVVVTQQDLDDATIPDHPEIDPLDYVSKDRRCEIRLFGIDAAESGDPFSRRAKEALHRMLDETEYRVELSVVRHPDGRAEVDKYGRLVAVAHPSPNPGELKVGGQGLPQRNESLNVRLVREGLAKVFSDYFHLWPSLGDEIRSAGQEARDKKRGRCHAR